MRHLRVTPLVDLLVIPLKAPPRIKVIPEIVEPFDFFLAGIVPTKTRYRLSLRESRLSGENRSEGGAELVSGKGPEIGYGIFDGPVDRVELTSTLGVGEGLVG